MNTSTFLKKEGSWQDADASSRCGNRRSDDIPCRETKTVVGGCAYNVANTLRNLHCEHDLCVPVGTGSFADIIRRGMKEKGYEPVIEEPSEDNGYCLSLVEADGERTFITVLVAECTGCR